MVLHPAATVVRGGIVRDVDGLRRKVRKSIDDGDGPCISVFVDVDKSDDEDGMSLYQLCTDSIPNKKIQLSTVGKLASAGFELELDTSGDQPRTHHNVTLKEPVEESELLRFIECFDEPVLNPNPKE